MLVFFDKKIFYLVYRGGVWDYMYMFKKKNIIVNLLCLRYRSEFIGFEEDGGRKWG